jgi:hypothetical protein
MTNRGIKNLRSIKHVRDLFVSEKPYRAFLRLAEELKTNQNKITVSHVSQLSKKLHAEKVYNRGNFYWYVLSPLIDLGFVEKIPTWNETLKRTQYSYAAVHVDIPRHPIGGGYYRDAWYLCKEWNDIFFGDGLKTKTASSEEMSEKKIATTRKTSPLFVKIRRK